MARIQYLSKKFARSSMEVIDRSNVIIESRDFLSNTQKSYSRLGDIINNARLAGLVDWNCEAHDLTISDGLSQCELLRMLRVRSTIESQVDKWEDQDWHVECWIEKDALVGVLERVCRKLDVAYFSCRGYTSQSEVWAGAQRLVDQARSGKRVMIVHLGDHDPSGMDMSRDIGSRLELFMGRYASNEDEYVESEDDDYRASQDDEDDET